MGLLSLEKKLVKTLHKLYVKVDTGKGVLLLLNHLLALVFLFSLGLPRHALCSALEGSWTSTKGELALACWTPGNARRARTPAERG